MLLHAVISGKVQNVGFRYFTKEVAENLGLKGYVRNLPDQTVEVVAEGKEETLERFLEELKKGPPLAKVTNIEYKLVDKEGGFSNFEIRY
ncbi:MAG: acylphosphatase [Aquificae bacterium]|nr:acylphosphatase [Aquificota bacterium]